MANSNDKVKDLYDFLSKEGYDFMGDENAFRESVKDDGNLNKLYTFLNDEGYDFMGSSDEFKQEIRGGQAKAKTRGTYAPQAFLLPSQGEGKAPVARPKTSQQPVVAQPSKPAAQPKVDMSDRLKGVQQRAWGGIMEKPTVKKSSPMPADIEEKAKVERAEREARYEEDLRNNITTSIERNNQALGDIRSKKEPKKETFWSSLARAGQTSEIMNIPLEEQTTDEKLYNEANKVLNDANDIVKAADYSAEHGAWKEFWQGMGKQVANFDTWDLGVSEMVRNLDAYQIIQKYDRGERLTPAETALMDAMATQAVVNQYYHDKIGKGYTVGQGTAESIPFMVEMILNPMSGAGSAAGRALGKYIIKKWGVKGTVKSVTRAVAKKAGAKAIAKEAVATATRTVGAAGGHLLGSAGMALTTGAPSVAADAVERQIGKVSGVMDGNGDIKYNGRYNFEENGGKALWKAFAARTIENLSETGMGAGNEIVGQLLGRGAKSVIGKIFGNNVGRIIEKPIEWGKKIATSRGGKEFGELMRRGQFHGVGGEFMEEIEGGITNAIIVKDQKLDDNPENGVFNKENLWDTFLQVAAMSALLGGGQVTAYGIGRGAEAWSQAHQLRQTDKAGKGLLGERAWNETKQEIDNAVNSISQGEDGLVLSNESKAALRNLMQGKSEEEREAIADYFAAKVKGEVLNAIQDQGLSSDEEAGLQGAYSRGYETMMRAYDTDDEQEAQALLEESMQEASDMAIERDQLREQLVGMIGEENVQSLENSRLGNTDIADEIGRYEDEEVRDLAQRYMEAHAAYRGVEDFANQSGRAISQATREQLQPTRDEQGGVRKMTLKDGREVYLYNGELAMNADGTVDEEGSSPMITVYDPKEEKRVPISARDIKSVEDYKSNDQVEQEIEDAGSNYTAAMLSEINGVNTLGIGRNVTREDGVRGQVIGEDEDSWIIGYEDGSQIPVNKQTYEQEFAARRLADYEARHPREAEPLPVDEVESGQPSEVSGQPEVVGESLPEGYEAGEPERYEEGMEVLMTVDGEVKPVTIGQRVSLVDREFVYNPEGKIIEYTVEGESEPRHIQEKAMADEVVGYKPMEEREEEVASGQEEAEVPTEEAPVEETAEAEELDESEKPMPMKQVKRTIDGRRQTTEEEDWQAVSPSRAYQYLYIDMAEQGYSAERADGKVAYELEQAKKALAKAEKDQSGSIQAIQARINEAQAVVDYWQEVSDMRAEDKRREAAENRQRDNRGESEVADAGEGDSGSREGQAERAEAGGERVEEEQPKTAEVESEFFEKLRKLYNDYETGENGYLTPRDFIDEVRNLVEDLPADSEVGKVLSEAFEKYDDTQEAYYYENGQRDDDGSDDMIEAIEGVMRTNANNEVRGHRAEREDEEQSEEEQPINNNEDEQYFKDQDSVDTEGGLVDSEVVRQSVPTHWREVLHGLGRHIGRRVSVLDGEAFARRTGNRRVRGEYNPEDNTIYLNADYVGNDEQMMSFVFGHELTHSLRDENPELWDSFVGFVKGAMGEEFDKQKAELRERYDRAIDMMNSRLPEGRRKYKKLSDAAIEEEVCADWAGDHMLTDEDAVKQILEEAEEVGADATTLIRRVLDWINGIVEKLKSLGQPADYAEKARAMWQQMYNVAVARNNAKAEAKVDLNLEGIDVDENKGDARMALADILEGEERDKEIRDLMEVTGRDRKTVERWMESEQSLAKIIMDGDNAAFLEREIDESVPSIWKNSDYPQGTVEFSNICRKRLPFTTVYSKLQKEFPNTVFNAEALETIRQTMKQNGHDVACGLCFVEDRRQLLGEIGQQFIEVLQGKPFRPIGEGGKEEMNQKQTAIIEGLKKSGDNYVPDLFELLTVEGMKQLRRSHPGVANAFIEYNNARGMQAGRLFQAYSAYHREILGYSPAKVKKINDNGGLRIFSFSDFEAPHLMDLVQVLADCAAKGIKVQGYTKVPEFAKAVKDTKAKVNRSLIAKGVGYVDADYQPKQREAVSSNVIDGKRLLFDLVEGIDVTNPNFFDSSDNENIGNILVGINDEQIRMAMADPFVDYIIPFHTGLKEKIRIKKGIGDWVNYQNSQLEKKVNDRGNLVNADKHGINIYTDVLQRSEELIGHEVRNVRDFQEAFLKAVAEKGWIPRFSQFLDRNEEGEYVYTPGYEKFLVDFKMFDKEGNILPQEAVVPEFDDDFNKEILDEYVEGERSRVPYDDLYNKVKESLGLGEESEARFSVSDETDKEIYRGKTLKEISNIQYAKAQEVLKALHDAGYKDFKISRSITDFGASTYIQGKYGLKFRISDHDVTSTRRMWDEVPFGLNTDTDFFVDVVKEAQEEAKKRGKELEERREKERRLDEKWDRIKPQFEGLGFKTNRRTYQSLEEFTANGKRSNVLQTPVEGGAFKYEWTEPIDEHTKEKPSYEWLERFDEGEENAGDNDVRFSVDDKKEEREEKTLMGVHNISEEKLKKAIKNGGLANPSMAVVDTKNGTLSSYGEISLIPKASLIDSRTGRNAGTYSGDAYTPVYPNVEFYEGKETEKRLEEITKGLPEGLAEYIRRRVTNYVDKNASTSGLEYVFLREKGQEMPIVRNERQYPNISKKEIAERIGADGTEYGSALYDEYKKLPEDKRYDFNLWLSKNGNEEEIRKVNEMVAELREEGHDEAADQLAEIYRKPMTFARFDTLVYNVSQDERRAGEENLARTLEDAAKAIDKQGLRNEFEAWKEKKIDELGYEERLFAGYTPAGNRRYLPNTVENASKLMNRQSDTNSYNDTGLNATRAAVMYKMRSLDDIRKHKDLLKGNEAYGKQMEEMTDRLLDIAHELSDMQKIDDNPFLNTDYAVLRLQEAMAERNPIAHLNKEYGYDIDEKDDLAKEIKSFIKDVKDMPAKYFETKFKRPVMLDEFDVAVVPDNVSEEVKQSLEAAGLNVVEYEHDNEESRREATLGAVRGRDDIRFSVGEQPTFYSNAERAVEGIKQEKATAEQWLKMIEKNGGLKAGEDKWLGLSEWLKGQKGSLTKQEVLDYIRANEIAVEDVEYSDAEMPDRFASNLRRELEDKASEICDEVSEKYAGRIAEVEAFSDELDELEDEMIEEARRRLDDEFGVPTEHYMAIQFDDDSGRLVYTPTRSDYDFSNDFAQEVWNRRNGNEGRPINETRLNYTTDGLENKKEIALVVPTIEPWNVGDEIHFGDAGEGRAVAWVRFGETTDADGKKVLVIDEIQSNRHQEGREKGYKGETDKEKIQRARQEQDDYSQLLYDKYIEGKHEGEDFLDYATAEEKAHFEELGRQRYEAEKPMYQGVPDAPFEKNWQELAMKRMLRYAAENGYDKVAWTKGEQQAERYDLSKVIDEIAYWKDGEGIWGISAGDKEDSQKIDQQTFTEKELVETFGREIADKIINDKGVNESVLGYPDDPNVHYLNGETIKIGGEGMKGFYDQMLPRFMDKYGKKWGVKTGEVELPNIGDNGLTMWSVDVTPEMRESVMEGQPMFSLPADIEEEGASRFSLVEDEKEIERLESEPKERGYRTVVLNEDGTLGSPMAGKLGSRGKTSRATSGFRFGAWEQAEENPDLADENGKIDLKKPTGKTVAKVNYNPYVHIRPTMLNKQFKEAWERPNLVYVETEYPASELDGGYKAEKAALSVGKHRWQGDYLILSRWDKPMRVMPWEEVADVWAEEFKDKGVNFDIVPPQMRDMLEERGVEILPPHKGMSKECNEAYEEWKAEREQPAEPIARQSVSEVLGEDYGKAMEEVYSKMAEQDRRAIDEQAGRAFLEDTTKDYEGEREKAVGEALEALADKDFEDFSEAEQTMWEEARRAINEATGMDLTDAEMRYILWRGAEGIESGKESPADVLRDMAKREELGLDEQPRFSVAAPNNTPPKVAARESYERMMASAVNQFKEATQDSMLSLKKLYEAIMGGKKFKIEDVPGYENAYLAENRMQSASQAQIDAWQTGYIRPIEKAVSDLCSEGKGVKHFSKKKYDELTDYMMAKHGLERNEVMAKRDAQEAAKNGANYQDAYDANRMKDYAGLTALTGKKDVAEAEKEAQRMVDEYEASHNVDELWKAVNNATLFSLLKLQKSGLISKERFDQIRQMYQYYIPLQGFDEKVAENVYAYLGSDGTLGYGTPIKTAKGRKSKADDPIATISMNGEATIRKGNRNEMKKAFLAFVQNHPSDLVSVSDVWLRKNAKGEWEQYFDADLKETDTPEEVERKLVDFEKRMEAEQQQHPDEYKRSSELPDVPFRVVENRDMKQHQVMVQSGGKTYVLTINGNPRAAQALNGMTNPDVFTEGVFGKAMNVGQALNRQLSLFYTTRNPEFTVSNFIRDMLYSNSMTWVKESPNYAMRFNRNFVKMNPAHMGVLFAEWESGKLKEKVNSGKASEVEKHFYDFMLEGGETGWTNLKDIEQHKKDLERSLRREHDINAKTWKAIGGLFDLMNRSVENCARFAAYRTSREMGRSVERSIWDAKEVSVNFNKKGAGDKFLNSQNQKLLGKIGSMTSGLGRGMYVFWNAGVQGLNNIMRAAGRHPGKAAIAVLAPQFMLGMLAPIAAALIGDDGDDDKNSYYNLPEYVRRSNFCFRFSKNMPWITIPLPIEFRAIYGLGELTTGVLTGKERYTPEEITKQYISQISQILPIDFMEGGGGFHAFIPSMLKPMVEAYENKGWTGLPIYKKETPWNEDLPEWQRAYGSANKQIVDATRWLNEATVREEDVMRAGGNKENLQGVIDWNPARIEYMLKGYFGGYTTMYDRLVKSGETLAGKRDFEWKNVPIASRVIKEGDERTKDRKIKNEYMDLVKEYTKTQYQLKQFDEETADPIEKAKRIAYLNYDRKYLHYLIVDEYKSEIDRLRRAAKKASGEKAADMAEAEEKLKKDMVELIRSIDEKGGLDEIRSNLGEGEAIDESLKEMATERIKPIKGE